ncbi:MAG: SGNH/GDSL hydrolase family protein [Planctomycetota bacterium]|nr:MAG: SGNH/GDSL hydrolase family protein [Planctomycetota bacterium]
MVRPQVFVLGDSISLDYGESLRSSLAPWADYRRKEGGDLARLNLDVAGGANGGDSGQVLEYLEVAADDIGQPDLMLLNCGLHDIKRAQPANALQVPIDTYATQLNKIITLAAQRSWPLWWLRITPLLDNIHNRRPGIRFHRHAADVDAYNACADQLMAAAGIPIIDLHAFTLGLGDAIDLYRDHVHFQPAICAAQGHWLAGCVFSYVFISRGLCPLGLPRSALA